MIIVIDEYYPFVDNRSFLSNELEEMAKSEDRIIVYPFSTPEGSIECINLPNNILIRNSACKKMNKITFAYSLVCGIFTKQFFSDLFQIIRKGITVKRIKSVISCSAKTQLLYLRIYKDMLTLHITDQEMIIYTYWMHLHACVGVKIKKRCKKSVLVTRAHGYDLYEERSACQFLPGRKEIFSYADLICPVSRQGVRYLENTYHYVNKEKVQCMYLGTYDSGTNQLLSEKKILVSCSYLVPVKRIELLIQALALVRNMEISWVHYGDGEERNKLEDLAKEILPDNIHYEFKGELDNKEILEEYKNKAFTYFINVSASEGLPISIMESVSFGIPVIATDVGGVNEIVSEKNGYLIKKDISPKELMIVICKALSISIDQYKKYKKESRIIWEEHFNAKKNYKSFFDTIHSIKI